MKSQLSAWRWWVVALLAAPIALYGLSYVVVGPRMFPENLSESFRARPWGIYPHALFGSVALVTGILQFRRDLLLRRRALHRLIGKIYVVASALVGVAGGYMAFYSFGGPVTHLGFGLLALALLVTTGMAFWRATRREIGPHRQWMVRSFALIYGAVSLRVELPLLVVLYQGNFLPAYQWVAWLAWVPNLLIAELYLRATRTRATSEVARLAVT